VGEVGRARRVGIARRALGRARRVGIARRAPSEPADHPVDRIRRVRDGPVLDVDRPAGGRGRVIGAAPQLRRPQSQETTWQRKSRGSAADSEKHTMTSRSQMPRSPRSRCSAAPCASATAATRSRHPASRGARAKKASTSASATRLRRARSDWSRQPPGAAECRARLPRPVGCTLESASQAAAAGEKARRGKSGHRRARWSGHRPGETRGKVPQKHTADGEASRGSRTGKGEMVR
jgi:hypothetical protein